MAFCYSWHKFVIIFCWGGLPLVGLPLEPGLFICVLSVCIKVSNLISKYHVFSWWNGTKILCRQFEVCVLEVPKEFLHLLCVCHSVGWVTLLLKLTNFSFFTSYLSEKRVKTCWGCKCIIYKCYWMSCIYGSLFVCLLFDLTWTEAYFWLWKRYFVLGV